MGKIVSKINCILIVSIIFPLFLFFTPQYIQAQKATYHKKVRLFELHPTYARITTYLEISFSKDKPFIGVPAGSFFSEEDIEEISWSSNIKEVKTLNQPSKEYQWIHLFAIPNEVIKKGELFSFWVTVKTRRLTLLNSKGEIHPHEPYLLGVTLKREPRVKANYRVFAFPTGTAYEVIEGPSPGIVAFDKLWDLLVYDISQIPEDSSIVYRLTLKEDSPDLDIEKVIPYIMGRELRALYSP